MRHRQLATSALLAAAAGTVLGAPVAHADNKRLNDSVVANVYTVQHQAGCTNDVTMSPALQLAAQQHAQDMMANRNLDGDIGSDGSTPQDRAGAAGYPGRVTETVAINPAMAISSVELMNEWVSNPGYVAIMSDCSNGQIGVWSENSLDRTVVVAVYGQSGKPPPSTQIAQTGPAPVVVLPPNVPTDPSPQYDASDEVEFAISWFPWILRGVYPPPAMPAQ